jgi:hypothetical protein
LLATISPEGTQAICQTTDGKLYSLPFNFQSPSLLLDANLMGTVVSAKFNDGTLMLAYRGDASQGGPLKLKFHREGHWQPELTLDGAGWSEETGMSGFSPAVATHGRMAAVAWFNNAGASRVKVAFSTDFGVLFKRTVQVDEGHPVGLMDVALLPDGSQLVLWNEQPADDRFELKLRRVPPLGPPDDSITLASQATRPDRLGTARLAIVRATQDGRPVQAIVAFSRDDQDNPTIQALTLPALNQMPEFAPTERPISQLVFEAKVIAADADINECLLARMDGPPGTEKPKLFKAETRWLTGLVEGQTYLAQIEVRQGIWWLVRVGAAPKASPARNAVPVPVPTPAPAVDQP